MDRGLARQSRPAWFTVSVPLAAWGVWCFVALTWLWPVIEDSYHGRGPAFLNGAFPTHRELWVYEEWWHNIMARTCLVAVAAALVWTWWPRQGWVAFVYERFVGPARAQTVAVARVVTAFVLAVSTAWEHLPSSAYLPLEISHPHGLSGWLFALPGFDALRQSPQALLVFQSATFVLLCFVVVGFKSRWTMPLASFGYFTIAAILRQNSNAYHTGLIPWYVLTVMCFCPASDAWSFDAWWARRRGRTRDTESDERRIVYGWARFALAATITLPYVEAGLSKFCNGGFVWWHPTNMRNILFTDSLNPMEFDWGVSLQMVHTGDWFFAGMGLAGVLGEVAMIAALVSRRGKLIVPGMMITMHVGILFLQNILFFDLIALLGLYYIWGVMDWQIEGPFNLVSLRKSWKPVRPAWRAHPRRELITQPSWGIRGVGALVAYLGICWVLTVEFFPLTAMQMYSHRRRESFVEYHSVMAYDASGQSQRTYPEHWIPALRDSRYRFIVRDCFDDELRFRCVALLNELGRLMRQQGEPVARLSVQKRRWDFAHDPDSVEHGDVIDEYMVAVGAAL